MFARQLEGKYITVSVFDSSGLVKYLYDAVA